MSNYPLLPVVLRMYYILSIIDDSVIPNINFKKELLNILIQKYLDKNLLNWYFEERFNLLESSLPFIKYDY